MSTYGDSSGTGLSWLEESTWGTTPSSAFTYLRYNGETLNYNIANETSKEIRSDSNITDLIQVGAEAGGGVTFEVSYENPCDELMCAAIRGADFGADLSAVVSSVATIACAAATDTYTASTGTPFSTVNVGDWIRVEGFTEAANNGIKLVTSVTAGNVIGVAQALADEAEGDSITMYGTTRRNGTASRSFSIQREHTDLDTPQYFLWPGMIINTFNMDVSTNQIITGGFDFMGGVPDSDTSRFGDGAAPGAAPTNDVYSAVSNVGTMYFDTTESTLEFMNISFNANNNLRGKPAIGTLGNIEIGKGIFEVTGSLSTYFENTTLYDKFVAGTEFALYFGLHSNVSTPASSNSYIFSFPRCKIENAATAQANSQNQDLMDDISWRAIYSSTSGCTMAISKIKATP